ncbi:MAG: hypothetical protein GY938_04995 [Ketobacter sp.]|nr:hypothetical protein [Ketobacter sp.]
MVEGQGLGPSDDGQSEELNLNAQNIHYGDFGSKDKNFMGDSLGAPPQENPVRQPPPAPEPGAVGELVTVKVDGVEKQVSQSELIRAFQMNEAADKRLNDATQILQQAQGVAAASLQPTATTPAHQTEADLSPTEPTVEPGLDDIDFAGIAENIQLGETNDGASALKDLATQIVARQRQDNAQSLDPAAFGEQVASIVQERTRSENARIAFEQNYPDIANDPELYSMAKRSALDLVIEDFVANGANDEMVDFSRKNPQRAMDAHRLLRSSGSMENLRSSDDVYTESGNRTRSWLAKASGNPGQANTLHENNPAPTPLIPRSERARAAQQSPQVRQAPATPAPQAEKVKSPSDIIQSMKRGRGQLSATQRMAAGQR